MILRVFGRLLQLSFFISLDKVNSLYIDGLQRFGEIDYRWGLENFMEISNILEEFVFDNKLIITIQLQVIRYIFLFIERNLLTQYDHMVIILIDFVFD